MNITAECPKCGYPNQGSYKGLYTPGEPCDGCGHHEPHPPAALPTGSTMETVGGSSEAPSNVLRVVFPPLDEAMAKRREACKRILREIYARVEAGEADELVVVAINSANHSSSRYHVKWQFEDGVRMSGALSWVARVITSEPFVKLV
jgi:hypothetical protein